MAVNDGAQHYRGKRALDLFILALVGGPALALGGVCAVAVRLTSRGPVIFKQERIGLNGRPFTLYKFRTMDHAPADVDFPDDARITAIGRVLRRTSLDELPQLWNVARGEMSIVGPRPTLRYQVDRYDERQMGRLSVRPGLTGLAQVSGRNSVPWEVRIEMDLGYVSQQSLATDLRLLARTVWVVIGGSGVAGHALDDPLARP